MIIPLKHKDYGALKSISMHHEEYGNCVVCFCDFKEVEDLIHEGWEISKDQKTLNEWLGAIDEKIT